MARAYSVRQRDREATAGADYVYDIFRDGKKVAEFRHNFRGEDTELRTTGRWIAVQDILVDDQSPPHRVSDRGAAILDQHVKSIV